MLWYSPKDSLPLSIRPSAVRLTNEETNAKEVQNDNQCFDPAASRTLCRITNCEANWEWKARHEGTNESVRVTFEVMNSSAIVIAANIFKTTTRARRYFSI